jgi:hypothetical protein
MLYSDISVKKYTLFVTAIYSSSKIKYDFPSARNRLRGVTDITVEEQVLKHIFG